MGQRVGQKFSIAACLEFHASPRSTSYQCPAASANMVRRKSGVRGHDFFSLGDSISRLTWVCGHDSIGASGHYIPPYGVWSGGRSDIRGICPIYQDFCASIQFQLIIYCKIVNQISYIPENLKSFFKFSTNTNKSNNLKKKMYSLSYVQVQGLQHYPWR